MAEMMGDARDLSKAERNGESWKPGSTHASVPAMGEPAERGRVCWITGRPQGGKSTFARALVERLRERGRGAVLLDGDQVRGALVPTPGYDERARDDFYATLTNLAWLLADQGHVVVVPATAHLSAFRERAKREPARFSLVFIDASPSVCAERDRKGLYRDSDAGRLGNLPGRDAGYEVPGDADVTASGGHDLEAIEAALRMLTP